MVTTRPPKTIVKPTALGPVANTDTKLLDLWPISKGPSFGTGRDLLDLGDGIALDRQDARSVGSWRIRLVLFRRIVQDNDLWIGVAQHLNVRNGPIGVGTDSAFEDLFLTMSKDPESRSFEFSDVLVEGSGCTYSITQQTTKQEECCLSL